MSTDAKGHTSIAAGENPTRAALAAAILSIRDAISVPNITARAAKIVELAGLGIVPSTSNPILFTRADATPGREFEYTIDGTNFPAFPAGDTYATISYGGNWRTPTTASRLPVRIYKRGGKTHVESGTVENAATLSVATSGQFTSALTVPVGFRPLTAPVAVPGTTEVAGTFLAAAMFIFNTDGTVTLQTTTAWSSVPAGSGLFNVAGASWDS